MRWWRLDTWIWISDACALPPPQVAPPELEDELVELDELVVEPDVDVDELVVEPDVDVDELVVEPAPPDAVFPLSPLPQAPEAKRPNAKVKP